MRPGFIPKTVTVVGFHIAVIIRQAGCRKIYR
jgi:hypothetical protein